VVEIKYLFGPQSYAEAAQISLWFQWVTKLVTRSYYGLRILSIIVLSVLSWALMILAIWMVGKFLVIVWPRRWFAA
jgi:hypothetical protein